MHRITKYRMDQVSTITGYDYYTFYLKNSRVVGAVWLILTICQTVCLIVVFASKNWVISGPSSPNSGYFGLYSFCVYNRFSSSYKCTGTWTDFSTLPHDLPSLKAACFFVGFSCLLSLLCIFISLFAIFVKIERIFHIIAWIQFLAFVCLFVGVCIYPISWDYSVIRSVCGERANQFELATCSIGWPYIIAMVLTGLVLVLSFLAVVLAARQAKYILNRTGACRDVCRTNCDDPCSSSAF